MTTPCVLNKVPHKDFPDISKANYEPMGKMFKCKYRALDVNEISRIFLNVYYMASATRDSSGSLNYTYLTELAKVNGIVGDYFNLLCEIVTEVEIFSKRKG